MGINSDGSIRLITEENVTVIPYNPSNNIDFIGSHIERWLNEEFVPSIKGEDKLVESKFCQGAKITTASTRTNCTGGVELSRKIGLISVDEYNLSGKNNSYLAVTQRYWTMSPANKTNIWYIYDDGFSYNNVPGNPIGIRPVINVDSNTIITKGDGTLSDNYILNDDKTIEIIGLLKNKAISGEYVRLADKIYRVMGINNDGTTKLLLDSYYQESAGTNYKMAYGNNNIFSTTSGIGNKMNTDVLEYLIPASDTINRKKIKTDAKWYQNAFPTDNNYLDMIKENETPIIASVGLVNMGEILTGQSASILTKNHIVNSNFSNAAAYWLLSPLSESALCMEDFGMVNSKIVNSTNIFSIRPAININADIKITSGSGTLTNPYQI